MTLNAEEKKALSSYRLAKADRLLEDAHTYMDSQVCHPVPLPITLIQDEQLS
jgi:hypothetical protein